MIVAKRPKREGRLDRLDDPIDYARIATPIGASATRYPDGYEIPPHAHGRDQLLHAISGVMRVTTPMEAWIVPPDRAVYIPAGVRHTVRMHGDVEMRPLYIVADAGEADRPAERALGVVGVSDLLRALILVLADADPGAADDPRIPLVTELVRLELDRARRLRLNLPLPRDPRLQRVCAALLADPANDGALEDWAAEAGAAPRTLARLFRQELGMTFGDWRRRVRFHAALEDLSRGRPIAQVAARAGYRSASAFTAAFGRAMGFRPSRLPDGERR